MPRDGDVHTYFGFDPGLVCLPVNSTLEPPFEKKVIEEEKGYVIFQDEYGVVSIRRKYPRLQILGGIDKMKIAEGKKAIDEELNSKIPFILRSGGYVPHIDHHVHPDISWKDFIYYRARLNEMIQGAGK